MDILDENGRLFGVVNIIDALVVVLIFAILAAGAALVMGGGTDADESQTVTLTVEISGVQPYVAEAIPQTGPVDSETVTAIENRTVEPTTVYTENESGAILARSHPELRTVTVVVTVDATRQDGKLHLEQQRLAVGSGIDLDFGTTVVTGNVTSVKTEN